MALTGAVQLHLRKKDDGTWKVSQMKRYIDDGKGDEWGSPIHRRHRRRPCRVPSPWKNARLCLLDLHMLTDYAEVIGAIEDVMLNETMIEVLDRLYWDRLMTGQRLVSAVNHPTWTVPTVGSSTRPTASTLNYQT